MRHTEFWARMEQALGPAYARSWAAQYRLSDLGCTAQEALDRGVAPKEVWLSVWRTLGLPASER